MKAKNLIKKYIPNKKIREKVSVHAFVNNGKDWWHVHLNEEVPKGHIQLVIDKKRKVDLYLLDIRELLKAKK